MKKHFFAFFFIALMSEIGTSCLARYRRIGLDDNLICYPNLQTMIGIRLLVWAVFFLLLSAVWLLLSRDRRAV